MNSPSAQHMLSAVLFESELCERECVFDEIVHECDHLVLHIRLRFSITKAKIKNIDHLWDIASMCEWHLATLDKLSYCWLSLHG